MNGAGGIATFVVMLTLAVTKFEEGAWIVVVVIPILVVIFRAMHRHYDEVAHELSLDGLDGPPPMNHTVLVLVGDLHRGVVRALQYARTLAPTAAVRGVYVETDPARTARLEHRWGRGASAFRSSCSPHPTGRCCVRFSATSTSSSRSATIRS